MSQLAKLDELLRLAGALDSRIEALQQAKQFILEEIDRIKLADSNSAPRE